MTWIHNPFFKTSAAVVVDSPPPQPPSQPQPQPQLPPTPQRDQSNTPSADTTNIETETQSNSPPDRGHGDHTDTDIETESNGSSSGRELRPPTTHVEGQDQGQAILRLQRPTEKMTGYQFFYIFVLDGIGAMVLSGGINFAIAYGVSYPFPFSNGHHARAPT